MMLYKIYGFITALLGGDIPSCRPDLLLTPKNFSYSGNNLYVTSDLLFTTVASTGC